MVGNSVAEAVDKVDSEAVDKLNSEAVDKLDSEAVDKLGCGAVAAVGSPSQYLIHVDNSDSDRAFFPAPRILLLADNLYGLALPLSGG